MPSIDMATLSSQFQDNNITATSQVWNDFNSAADNDSFECASEAPAMRHLLVVPRWYLGLLGFYGICTIISLVVYFEEIHFITHNFNQIAVIKKTIWILAFFPVFTLTSFMAVLLPRSGTLCDLVSNVFFVTCLYQFLGLMTNYLGGRVRLRELLSQSRVLKIKAPPCCCCCVCFPDYPLNMKNFKKLIYLVTQMTVFRPLLLFVAAVLWTNDAYIPGHEAGFEPTPASVEAVTNSFINQRPQQYPQKTTFLHPQDGFIYIASLNVISTMIAMWGLNMIKISFREELEKPFSMSGKISCLQLSMISSAVPYIVIGFLVKTEVIPCTHIYSAKTVGALISRGIIIILLFLYGLLARRFFRRIKDAETLNQIMSPLLPVPINDERTMAAPDEVNTLLMISSSDEEKNIGDKPTITT